VDVVEIGSKACDMGGVYQVKPLGEPQSLPPYCTALCRPKQQHTVLCLLCVAAIDDGRLCWGGICIRAWRDLGCLLCLLCPLLRALLQACTP